MPEDTTESLSAIDDIPPLCSLFLYLFLILIEFLGLILVDRALGLYDYFGMNFPCLKKFFYESLGTLHKMQISQVH